MKPTVTFHSMSWKKQNNSERDSVCKSTFGFVRAESEISEIANHFWRASCNKTHILTLVSSLLESLRAYDYLGQHDSCLLFLYAYLFSLQLDLHCRLSVQPLAIQMITLLAPSHSSMLDVSLLTHLWAGSDHSKPNQAHWISEGSIATQKWHWTSFIDVWFRKRITLEIQ